MTKIIFNKKKNYQTSITKMFGNNTIIVRRSAAKARLRVDNGGLSVGVFLQYSCGTDPIDTAGGQVFGSRIGTGPHNDIITVVKFKI